MGRELAPEGVNTVHQITEGNLVSFYVYTKIRNSSKHKATTFTSLWSSFVDSEGLATFLVVNMLTKRSPLINTIVTKPRLRGGVSTCK